MATELLAGVTVLDFTAAFVGPFCSRIMADMGAEVIKIERPAADQDERFTPESLPTRNGVPYLHLNGGKKSLCVDLKTDAGLEIVRALGLTIGNSLPAWAALGIVIWISRKRNSRTPIEC